MTLCTYFSGLMILDGRFDLYPSSEVLTSASRMRALVLLACAGRLSVHFKMAFSSEAKYFIPPATFASLLIVCSPR